MRPLYCSAAIALAFLAIAIVFVLSRGERYCILWPGIDTVYAKGYTKRAFESVSIGATEAEVRKFLGPPLNASTKPNGTSTWWYTKDGDGMLYDFAWLGRSITFSNGVVLLKEKHIFYD